MTPKDQGFVYSADDALGTGKRDVIIMVVAVNKW